MRPPADDLLTVQLRRDEVEWLEMAARHGSAATIVSDAAMPLRALARKLHAVLIDGSSTAPGGDR